MGRIFTLLILMAALGLAGLFGAGGCGGGSPVNPPAIVSVDSFFSEFEGCCLSNVFKDAVSKVEVTVTFDDAIDPTTINENTFYVTSEDGVVEGSVMVDGTTAVFVSTQKLKVDAVYAVTITSKVANISGAKMASDYEQDFSIGLPYCSTYFSMELDPAFGTDGKSTISPGHKIAMTGGILMQTDGKVLFSGYYGDVIGAHDAKLAVIRTDSETGNLDTTFGTGGIAWVDCNSNLGLYWWIKQGLAIQTDGKILVGGECNSKAAVFRLNQDGSPDNSFGTSGKAELPLPGYVQLHATVFSLGTQQSGGAEKIIVGGQSVSNVWKGRWVLARLNSDGTPDNTFAGGAGIIFQEWRFYDEGVIALAVLPDSSIIAYGVSIKDAGPTSADFALAHYSADGVLDTSFAAGDPAGVAGLAVMDYGFNDWAYDMKVTADGRIVGGAHVHDDLTGLSNNFGVFRMNADGLPDRSFGTEGKVEIDFGFGLNDMGNAIALLPDGQMILGGESNNGAGGPENNNFGFVMLDANGNINTHFGTNGFIWTDFAQDHSAAMTMALNNVVTNDDNAVDSFELFAAGWMTDPASGDTEYAIAKYRSVPVELCSE